MRLFQGLVFLCFGVGLLAVAVQGLTSGWLPFGPKGLEGRLEFRRAEAPGRYWLAFAGYAFAGIWLTIYAIAILAGTVPPLPLR